MIAEENYDFLKRMRVIHKPNRRDISLTRASDEVEIDNSWKIVIDFNAPDLVRHAASDFQDYLLVSMNVSVPVCPQKKIIRTAKTILLTHLKDYSDQNIERPVKRGGFALDVSPDLGILILGAEERGVFYGSIHLEYVMNLREAPLLKQERYVREPLLRMRSVHSGSGIDDYPDWQLNAIVHAGFTAIDLFTKGPNTTTKGYCNINDVIERASHYGLDVVMYSYLSSYKHPDDPDAEEFFDSVYGNIFRCHPGFAAIHLVGESMEFPSKDQHTTGKRWDACVVDGIQDPRPSPGWYPCCDFPAYLKCIADAVHKVKPEAEVIINTYNWDWVPTEERKKFLAKLPKGITLQVTYDILYEQKERRNGLSCPLMDYSISADQPGDYFTSEVKAANEVGIQNIRVTSNLAGTTWDFGTAPYVPVPFRWMTRMNVLKEYLLKYHVNSFYDSHHYGWWPNPCNDMAKELFSSHGETDMESLLKKVAVRDYGQTAGPGILKVWRIWSDSMDHYVGTNEDQYGPWRTGPAYPFLFQPNMSRTMTEKKLVFPTAPYAHFGADIIKTYMPYENENQSPAPLRYPVEIRELTKMLSMWEEGLTLLEKVRLEIPIQKSLNGDLLYALGKFIRNSIKTTLNMKNWWILNMKLQIPAERESMLNLLNHLESLAYEEIANAEDTIEVVRIDSRIGWEPSMEYVCDEWHLNWKIRQMKSMLTEVASYRKMIKL